MTALKNMPVSFPGLFGDWSWNPDPIAIHIGHGIYWYGIILAVAMLCGAWLAMRRAPRCGLSEENILDLVLLAVPCCIISARIYYVVFNLELYRTTEGGIDFWKAIAIWDGGIAIYGAVLTALLVAYVYARVKGIPFGALADTAIPGLMLGQVIGRWANFINREAFGSLTTLPWRMRLWTAADTPVEVHPTFFYESMWNLAGLVILLRVVDRRRRFDGQNLCFYLMWYGLGRAWIEGLRTDSLYLFGLVTPWGSPVRVSQALSVVIFVTGAVILVRQLFFRAGGPENLYVNRKAREADLVETIAQNVAKAEESVTDAPENVSALPSELPGDAPGVSGAEETGAGRGEAVRMDGKALAERIKAGLRVDTADLPRPACLAVILVGDNPASKVYVAGKERDCKDCGIQSRTCRLSADANLENLLTLVNLLNEDESVDGILCQLPLPAQIDPAPVLRAISPDKDVDCFHPYNAGLLFTGEPEFQPCTPKGIMALLKEYHVPIRGKRCVVIGRSNIVGKPMAHMLLAADATVTVCHSRTENLASFTREADILICAAGKRGMITADMVKEGAAVIDVAMNRDENGKLCGDVDYEGVSRKAGWITPVPGGVGPMTRAMLMENILLAARNHTRQDPADHPA